ncbi:hypothetical protein [Cohnella luojiensis]|uniref:Cobalamin biosynthesis protein CbiN n=1 Tax=Cohnella luojiensis TaxID=652876 RepID=A0A4Y8LNP5_9BACL|nr:hypothetical protein [Cohnella luojiensis]TFE22587.1 hypothetical protein E2980_21615 [Cohnella luojiensis]
MKAKLPLLLLGCFMISLLSSPERAYACSCEEQGVEQRYEEASVVFMGTVKETDREGGNLFEVERTWKGKLKDSYVYGGSDGMCGMSFKKGVKYLVFTYPVKGVENTGLCSGNHIASDVDADIKILNRLAKTSAADPVSSYIGLGAIIIVFLGIIMVISKKRGQNK